MKTRFLPDRTALAYQITNPTRMNEVGGSVSPLIDRHCEPKHFIYTWIPVLLLCFMLTVTCHLVEMVISR